MQEYVIDSRGLATPRQASEYLHATTGTLAVWRCKGGGPRFIKRGNRVFYSYAEIDRHLAALPAYGSTAEYPANTRAA